MSESPDWLFVVIDDDPSDVRILEWQLRGIDDREIRVESARSLEEALDLLDRHRVDLVFVDYHLGATDGLEVLAGLKRAGVRAPIVMLSGRGDERLAVEALQHGAADYIPKQSLSTDSLRRSVKNALEKSLLERELELHRRCLERSNVDLQRRTQEIESFYHTLSHELKTPLTSVREFTSILLDGLAGSMNQEQRSYLEIVLEGCEQMRLFLDDILDASRLETGKLAVNRSRHDLSVLIAQTVASLSLQAEKARIQLVAECDEDVPPVEIDEHRIVQVLNNLIGNALKYTEPGGRITVHASCDPVQPGRVRVSIRDTGCGIEQCFLDRVFDRLFQVRESDTSTHGGLGLGLAICKGIIDLHGGEIRAASQPGVGSEFTFLIPSLACERSTAEVSTGEET